MKIVYLGSAGSLSCIPLRTLLQAGRDIVATGAAGAAVTRISVPTIPVIVENHETVESITRVYGIPVIGMCRHWQEERQLLQRYAPDVILVSCFPYRLPDEILSLPASGCFNLHPSLLPAYRGPAPLYWQFRDQVRKFGVTLHRMSGQLDAGPIIGQCRVPMPDNVSMSQAEQLLANAGSELMQRLLADIQDGCLTEREQDEKLANYQGFPPPDIN